ncbi:23852_t:CDS:2, partial [Racocetra persica]
DMKIPELSINLKKHSDILCRYASKLISTHEIAQQYKERNNRLDTYGSIPIASADIPDIA